MEIRRQVIRLALSVICLAGCDRQLAEGQAERVLVDSRPPGSVKWASWARSDSARATNLPILLYLYSRRSFWSQTMSRLCFTDSLLVRDIQRGTLPISIDVDRRPDLAERYGMGSWPSVFFLTPEGLHITGSGYMDKEDLSRLLRRVRVYFDNDERRDDLRRERGYLEARLRRMGKRRRRPSPALSEFLEEALDSTRTTAARGTSPGAEGLMFLLEYGRAEGTSDLAVVASKVVDRVIRRPGGEEGLGYFLAPLTSDGMIQDRERNLPINAQLLSVLSQLSVEPESPYRKKASSLGDELIQGFLDERDSLLVAGYLGSPDSTTSPAMDPTYFASWNALAISGFLDLYELLGDARYLSVSRSLMGSILREMRQSDGFIRHFPNQDRAFPLLLEDQALVARAALDLYEASSDQAYLDISTRLVKGILDKFWSGDGGMQDRYPESEAPLSPVVDRLVPSGNGVAVQVLLRLHAYDPQGGYKEACKAILKGLLVYSDRIAFCGGLSRGILLYTRAGGSEIGLPN
jgi:uncharacterized protein YyaL (SSP411 family)